MIKIIIVVLNKEEKEKLWNLMRNFACYTKVFNYTLDRTGGPEKQRNCMQAMFQSERESLLLEQESRLKKSHQCE